ncbi:hypothetical protein [Nocardia sp. R7R-8]|uniref:hypothetical protein n=1 Tax=Nocardia sp. R7R-8 TaxID=3459304 RepID=UPI00403DEE0C
MDGLHQHVEPGEFHRNDPSRHRNLFSRNGSADAMLAERMHPEWSIAGRVRPSGSRSGDTVVAHIMIAGYTAAGKTTHARLLADSLGYQTVWAAGLLLERLGFDVQDESHLWFHRYDEVARRRSAANVDTDLDQYLVSRAASEDDTVFDARFLPWAFDLDGVVRVWLESDLLSRARKCAVSLGPDAPSIPQCAVGIDRKDLEDVVRVAETFGAVYSPDYSLFDIVIDNSCLFLGSKKNEVELGIARCQEYLSAAVDAVLIGRHDRLDELERANPVEFNRVVRQVASHSRGRGRADR